MADDRNTPPPGVPMTPTRRRLGSGGGAPRPQPSQTAPADPQAAEISGALPAEATAVDQQPPAAVRPSPAEQAGVQAPAAGTAPTPRPGSPPTAPPTPGGAERQEAQAERAVPARGGPAGPAPAARPAAAAGRPAAAGSTAERLSEAVQRQPAASGGGEAQSQGLVYVWPHLVTIEFISAALLLLSMIVLSWVVNAPLESHANPDRTPNPSKAPWYFLNLQELLLHMHPALAGVIVPSAALGAIAAIPYFDRDTTDVGKWFGTAKAVPITIFTAIYTTIVEVALVFLDEPGFQIGPVTVGIGVKPLMTALANATGITYFREQTPLGVAALSMPDVIIPTLLMLGPIAPMMWIIHKRWKPNTREVMIALFTGFFVSFVILTIFGTFFRGQGMHLCWATDPCQIRIE